eukprot:GHVQ01010446.1.p1 GENE.GHVQ01010446.1~~GHVQ01010446.1.p1  ORF type:complete len:196 (-),score=32.68 GHVQ01010446.1:1729-2316(-)
MQHLSLLRRQTIAGVLNPLVKRIVTIQQLHLQQHFVCSDRRWYSNEVHDHFKNPRNVGSFSKEETNIGTAIVGKAACGDVIKLQVKVNDTTEVIEDARFKTFGCGSAIASSSLATEMVKGQTCNQALGLKNTQISSELSLPPVKLHCSLLAEDAVKHAVHDYLVKKKKRVTEGGGGEGLQGKGGEGGGPKEWRCE